jgi:hypothetical protein
MAALASKEAGLLAGRMENAATAIRRRPVGLKQQSSVLCGQGDWLNWDQHCEEVIRFLMDCTRFGRNTFTSG